MPRIVVLRERFAGETRVAASPETVKNYVRAGFEVCVESGAGLLAAISDAEFEAAGASIIGEGELATGDLVLGVWPAPVELVQKLREGAILATHVHADQNLALVEALRDRKISTLAMELVPRISRAQVMDSLSSQANLAGYKAVLVGAARSQRMFALMMTAAGTIRPANVVILGAGVAGLQAIATAKRLGAIVEVSDVRPAAKEQVESLGGKFIPLPESLTAEGSGGYARPMTDEEQAQQRAIVREKLVKADLVITTALVPGRPAPKLIDDEALQGMKTGAIIIDLASSRGGNTNHTPVDGEATVGGVTIVGASQLARSMSVDASALYARNLKALVDLIGPQGALQLNLEDEIVAGALLTHAGEIRHEPTARLLQGGAR